MSDVFISYKREDESRVGRLAMALQDSGIDVWWDRTLVGGESWRAQIQAALAAAKCVIVVWTHDSVGPQGDFVRDEAGQAKRRGILVPVLLDKVSPPLGFGEIQAIDLTNWSGSQGDPFFLDLCESVTAKIEGRANAPAKGPTRRLMRRLAIGGASSVLLGALVIVFNLFNAQDQLCGAPWFQPRLSDACGNAGLGRRPSKAERVAWEARAHGSCDGLRAHIQRFPEGAFRQAAADLLEARKVKESVIWVPASRRLSLFVGQPATGSTDEAAARADAMGRAQSAADRLCKGFAATTLFQFKAAEPQAQSWHCEQGKDGVSCGFEGEALCQLDERRDQKTESCGG